MRFSDRRMAGLRIEWIGRWQRQAAGLALAVALPCADAQPSQRCLRVTYSPDSLRLVFPRVFLLSAQRTHDNQYIGAHPVLMARFWPSPDAPFVRQQWTLLRGLGGWRMGSQDSLLAQQDDAVSSSVQP